MFASDVQIERGATAEYIKPVPMGSPRNYLGTGDLFNSGATHPPTDDFWVSVSGYCARREHGDRMTPRTDSNGGPANGAGVFAGCNNTGLATSAVMGANPEWRANGYFYAIELDDGIDTPGDDPDWPYDPVIEVYDAAHCEGAGTDANDSGTNGDDSVKWGGLYGGRSGQREYTYTLRSNDSPFNPAAATAIQATTVGPNRCTANGNYAANWRPVGTLADATEGIYYLQIDPVVPLTDMNGTNSQEGQNQLSIRARDPGWPTTHTSNAGWPCTSDVTTVATNVEARTDCPRVYGLTHLGVYVSTASATAQPFLAEIGPEHAGKEVSIDLFDAAEGMSQLRILAPGATAPYSGAELINFTWEVGCQDGTFESEGGNCGAEGDPDPAGADTGRGPFTNRTAIDVSGPPCAPTAGAPSCDPAAPAAYSAVKPYNTRNSQFTRFSDNLIRISFTLPTLSANPTWYGGFKWFKIDYTAPGVAVGDRTTWSVQIKGDPVRLVE
jgi:hypothetical protein